MTPDEIATQIADELRRVRFRIVNEAELQEALEAALINLEHKVEREFRLNQHDRPDFLIDDVVAMEVKVKGPTANVVRQLARYAADPRIHALILVTTRMRHSLVPGTVNGKPLHVIPLALGGL